MDSRITKVYFVRHATPDLTDKSENRPLSKKGFQDANLVYQYLFDKKIDMFVSSPYPRSIQTIEKLAEKLEKEILLIDDLRERKIGQWVLDFEDFSKKQWNDFNYKIPGGESLNEVQRRNVNALEELLMENKGKVLCIGTHGTALSTIINYYDNSFGYQEFNRIKGIMPWVVKMTFDKQNNKVNIEEMDLLQMREVVI